MTNDVVLKCSASLLHSSGLTRFYDLFSEVATYTKEDIEIVFGKSRSQRDLKSATHLILSIFV